MKKLATILLTLLCFASTQSFAQMASTALHPTKATIEPQSVYLAPPKYLAPLAPLTNDALFYVDTNTGQFRYEVFPGQINLTTQTGTEVDTILGYAEHFTAPYVAYLDSVQFTFAILNAASFDGNKLMVNVNGQTISNGIPYAGTFITGDSITNIGDPDLFPVETALTFTMPFAHKRVGKDFFVSILSAYDINNEFTTDFQNRFLLFGDSLDYPSGTTFDKNIHRGYIEGAHYQLPYTGISFGQADPFYSNFWITAYVTNQATAVEDTKLTGNALAQNFPNPFNPSTEIRYSTSERVQASLKVYNTLGNVVATLVDGMVDAGEHSVNFKAAELPTGTYYYTLKAGSFTQTKRMVLAK